jgi:SAM-dependent methyltransferase
MKHYDRAYFDRWYRSPHSRITTPAEVARKARMVLGIAEVLLGRPVRSVLDIGCGEGVWLPILRRLRPALHYTGVDSSEYAVRRYGARRNIHLGTFGELDAHDWRRTFDLVVCCDVLNYLPARELRRGLGHLGELLGGVAYLEIFTRADAVTGDRRGWHARPAAYYRMLLHRAGLTSCGMHCYVGSALSPETTALERL